MTEDTVVCGIIMPISGGDADHDEQHWKNVLKVLSDAIMQSSLLPVPVWQNAEFDIIQSAIIDNLYTNPLCICDVSTKNPNVMIELGLRLSTGKPTVVVAELGTKLPFDTGVINTEFYDPKLEYGATNEFIKRLCERLCNADAMRLNGKYRSFVDHFHISTASVGSHSSAADILVERVEAMGRAITRIEHSIKPTSASFERGVFDPTSIKPALSGSLQEILEKAIAKQVIRIGSRIHHGKFGDGTVAHIESETKIEVDFDTVGPKRVMTSFVKLID